ncbi:MAG: hypothetical protein P1P82_11955 [Bacteroidales bacterium]|nr:hypothetical protein [Bacteroidales bacterium]MDT8431896.1 hypothetical protein [Bacteroidales bacterium]
MRRTTLLVLIVLPLTWVYGQREHLPSEEALEVFHATKTYIVLQDNPISDYNLEITDAVNQYWDITEYEFLSFDDFLKRSRDTKASFLYTATVSFEKDKSDTRYTFLCLSLGGDHATLDQMKDIVNIPLSYYGVDEDSYSYKLGTLVHFMQKHVRMITEHPEMISQNVFNEYNDNMSAITGKTLYVIEEELENTIGSEARFRSVYPHAFKFVTREEVKEAIMNKDEDVVFLHKVGPEGKKLKARVYKILIGAGDSEFYYFDYHKVNAKKPDAFLEDDLKKLSRTN